MVTGTSQLAHGNFLTDAALGLYALLVAAWLTVATRTSCAALHRLFLPAPNAAIDPVTATTGHGRR